MSVSYENLWNLLDQKGLKRVDLCEKAGISTNTLAKLGKNESVKVDVLSRICGALECTFDDIVSNTGENAIIAHLPNFKFYDLDTFGYDIFEYDVVDEFETLNIQTLNDFPKPHTINNIKKTLTRYIKEGKLSIKSVNALLTELKKYNISIVIDEKTAPEYERIPKKLSVEDKKSNIYKTEYQQALNYLYWCLNTQKVQNELRQISQKSNVPYITETEDTDVSRVSYEFEGEDAIKYVAPVQKMHKDSLCYPYNLLKDIFDGIVGEDLYSFLYRHNQICDVVEQTLKNLTVTEEAVLKSLYINSKSISEIYKGLGLPGNDIMETLFEEKFYRRPLRKLRRPPMVRSLLSSFLHDQYCFTCQLNELKWHYIDSYFKDESSGFRRVNIETIQKISNLEYIDHILSVYIADSSYVDNSLIIVESLYKGELQWHLLLVDFFGNIFKVKATTTSEILLKNIIKTANYEPIKVFKSRHIEYTLEELDLSVRSFSCLRRAGMYTLEDVVTKTEDDFMKVRNLGKKCLDEIICKVKQYGYYLNDEGIFEYHCLDNLSIVSFAKYYIRLYSRNKTEEEQLLIDNFFEHCNSLGYSLKSADWFVETFMDTTRSLNDISVIDKINNSELLGSIILKKWQHITQWSSEGLLSKENRIWFIIAFSRLYQIGLEKTEEKN